MKLHFPCVETAYVTQVFGVNKAAYGRFGLQGHNGVDFGAPIESPIYACADGVVVLAEERNTGYGRHVRIEHNLFMSLYGHLQFMNVGVGDVVKAGDEIGGMGGDPRDGVPYDGNSTGTHLHFEIRPDGEPANNGFAGAVDPIAYLNQFLEHKFEGKVTARNGLNFRNEPNGTKIGTLSHGEVFQGQKVQEGDKYTWMKLRSLRGEWIAADFTDYKEIGPVEYPTGEDDAEVFVDEMYELGLRDAITAIEQLL